MDSLRTDQSWFVSEMVRVTTDMWRKGWDERNGGNVSLRLLPSDVEPYLPSWTKTRIWPLTLPVAGLDGEYFLVTGTGAYFRNVEREPEENLGVIRVLPSGAAVEIMWGFGDAGFLLAMLLATAAWMRHDEAATRRRESAEDARAATLAAAVADPVADPVTASPG